jgi:hypothetical protein
MISSPNSKRLREELVVYLDESGTDAANPCLVVAGFASDAAQWARLTEEMTALDREYVAPPFHMATFEKARHGHGAYAVWPAAKRHEYLNRLLGMIRRRCFKSFATMLEKSAYEEIIRPHRAFQEYFYSPFVFAAVNTIHAVRQWRDSLYPGKTLRFVFDRGNKNAGQLIDVSKRVFIGSEENVQDVVLGDDLELPPLRAADLLAFELCAEGRRASGPRRQFSRYALIELDDRPHDWVAVGEETLLTEIDKEIKAGTFILGD